MSVRVLDKVVVKQESAYVNEKVATVVLNNAGSFGKVATMLIVCEAPILFKLIKPGADFTI